ncbi:MAG: DUF4410 domain-containing protein [Desulfovibrio sp.]
MKKIIAVLILSLMLTACGTRKHHMAFVGDCTSIPATAKYTVKAPVDNSKYDPNAKGAEQIVLTESMDTALVAELKKHDLYAEDPSSAYTIFPTITEYNPGNAFGRWLMPGVGSTKLLVSSSVLNSEGSELGVINSKNTVDAGGGYTIGAWKYVFEQAAVEIVEEVRESMGLLVEKDKKSKK